MVEGTRFEIGRGVKLTVGSNPTLYATAGWQLEVCDIDNIQTCPKLLKGKMRARGVGLKTGSRS